MVLDNFDFTLLDSGGFLEDSVREEIITPILHELGYKASGENCIKRSVSLTHPYVYIGTIQRKINIIPDYILHVKNEPTIVLDAKAPNENIISGPNVEQAFSYAIHKDVRAWSYSLCNGRLLSIFSIYEYEPIAVIDLKNLKSDWKILEKHFKPEYIERPYLADFHPDLGITMKKINTSNNTNFIFEGAWINSIIKMSENEYTISSGLKYGEDDYLASFDFNKKQYKKLLEIIPATHKKAIEISLSRQPFSVTFKREHIITVGVVANLTTTIIRSAMTNESFLPFKVVEFFS